jgi:hypothetical protein
MEDNLCITVCPELMSAAFQFFSDLKEVVDFTIVTDYMTPIVRHHWLSTRRGEIQN